MRTLALFVAAATATLGCNSDPTLGPDAASDGGTSADPDAASLACSEACEQPPDAVCATTTTLRQFGVGTCAMGSCVYAELDQPCLDDERCDAAACAFAPVIAADQGRPSGLTNDATHVYWTNNDGQVMRRLKTESQPEVFAGNEPYAFRIAVDDTGVYWTQYWSDELRYRTKGGGEIKTLAEGAFDIAIDATHVYFTDFSEAGGQGGVRRWSKDSGEIETLYQITNPVADESPHGIALDEDYVYWSDFNDGAVRRIAKVGGPVEMIYVNPEPEQEVGGGALEVDDHHVYWISVWANELWRAPKAGGTAELLATATGAQLALDVDHVYWSNMGGVFRQLKTGSPPELLSTNVYSADSAVSLDDDHIYWTNMFDPDDPGADPLGEVLRMRKPQAARRR